MKKRIILSLLVPFILFSACFKEVLNPNAASSIQVLGSQEGLISLLNGTIAKYARSPLYYSVTASAFSTNGLRLLNQGNTDGYYLSQGGLAVDGSNGILGGLWTDCNGINFNGDNLIANAKNAGDPATVSALKCYGYLFKGLALGTLAQYWQQVPISTGSGAKFSSRSEALKAAIASLQLGEAQVNLLGFTATLNGKIAGGINVKNSLSALQARYYTMLGDSVNALTAASKVDLSVKSVFNFDDLSPNPIFNNAISSNNYYQPIDTTLGLPMALYPNPADKRLNFYTILYKGDPKDTRALGFVTANNSPFPLYLPGEMLLIKAEAYARQGDLVNAVTQLNLVLTKTPQKDVFGLGASLPSYTGSLTRQAVLQEIYRNRRIELYLSGLELEDCRRFGRPGPESKNLSERNRSYYPYPNAERTNNSNTPADPAF